MYHIHNDEENEPNSCPFCGGKARVMKKRTYRQIIIDYNLSNPDDNRFTWHGDPVLHFYMHHSIYVMCNKCHAKGSSVKTGVIDFAEPEKNGWQIKTKYEREFKEGTGKLAPFIVKAIELWNRRVSDES